MKKKTTNKMKNENTNTVAPKCTPAPECFTQAAQDRLNCWDFTTPVTLWQSMKKDGKIDGMVWVGERLQEDCLQEIAASYELDITPTELEELEKNWALYDEASAGGMTENAKEMRKVCHDLQDRYDQEKREALHEWMLENTSAPSRSFWLLADKLSQDVRQVNELFKVSHATLTGLKAAQMLSSDAIARRMGKCVEKIQALYDVSLEVFKCYQSAELPTREQSEALKERQAGARHAEFSFDGKGLDYHKETAAKNLISVCAARLTNLDPLPMLDSRQDANSYRVDILRDMQTAHNETSGMTWSDRPQHGAAHTAWVDIRKSLRREIDRAKNGQKVNLEDLSESVAVLKLVRGMAITKELNRELEEGKASETKAPAWHEAVDAFDHYLNEFRTFEKDNEPETRGLVNMDGTIEKFTGEY